MEISTKKIMADGEVSKFQAEHREVISKLVGNVGITGDISIEIPNYSSIDGINCASVKLGSKRRKTGINDI